jgi:hypothetical protein
MHGATGEETDEKQLLTLGAVVKRRGLRKIRMF